MDRKIIVLIATMAAGLILTPAADSEEIPQQFEGFNLQGYTQNGEKAWDVNGDTADVRGNTIEITNVDAKRYGDQSMNLTAKTGVIDKASGYVHLEKDVVITSSTGGRLTTDSLDWHKDQDLVTTDDHVEITDKAMHATGTGLKAKPGLKTAQMNEDVTVKVKTEPEKAGGREVTITCDGPMEIEQAKNMAVFNRNVVAIQDDRTLKADRMEVHFNPSTNQIEQTICIGNVEILQGENKTYSERAVYTAYDKKLTLLGRPKMIMITEGEGAMGPLE